MIPVPPIEEVVRRRIFGSMQAYLDGEKNLKWVLSMIESNTRLAAALLVNRFGQYAHTQRYQDLQASLATCPPGS